MSRVIYLRVVLAGFGVIGSRTEDDHRNGEKEEEHAELSHAGLDRQAENTQTVRMFRQLKDAENTQDAREQERTTSFLAARTNARRQQVRRLHHPPSYSFFIIILSFYSSTCISLLTPHEQSELTGKT